MKNEDVLFYEMALDRLKLKGIDITIVISRNQDLAATEAKRLRSAIEPSDKVREYRQKYNHLQVKHAKKNAEGNVIMRTVEVGGNKIDIPDIDSFNDPEGEYAKDFAALRAEYNGELTEFDQLLKEFKEKMQEENEYFIPILIDYEIIPKDISSEDMNIIYPLIDKKTMPKHLWK